MNAPLDRLDSLRLDPEDRAEAAGHNRRRPWWVIAAILVPALALAAFLLLRPRPAEVVTAAAGAPSGAPGRPASVLNASGYVTARRQATVSSKITGKVVEVRVDEGMRVEQGQVLALLDDATALAQLRLSEAELERARSAVAELDVRLADAQRTLARSRDLLAKGVTAQADLDRDQAAVDAFGAQIALARRDIAVSERRVVLARQDLDDTIIRAPFTGVAISKDAQPGEMISPVSAGGGFTRTGICTLVDMTSLEIEVDVSESFIGRVEAGQEVEAVLDSYPDWRIPARVITTIPAADRQKATVKVRVGFASLDPRILPDMGVKVTFFAPAPAETGAGGVAPPVARATVPRAAVRSEGDTEVVLTVRDGRVERRAVATGRTEGEVVELLSGVEPGERVIVDGPAGLTDGERVREREGGR